MEQNGKYSALIIAEYILEKGYKITHLKLQKILYYIKVWSIVANKPIIKDIFEAWKYGPVCPKIYDTYKKYGNSILPISLIHHSIDSSSEKIIEKVLETYLSFSAIQLSEMTHNKEPWLKSKNTIIISEKDIKKYYSKLPFSKNFVDDKTYHPTFNTSFYSFVFDMDVDDELIADLTDSFKSFKDYSNSQKVIKKEIEDLLSANINA